MAQVIVVGGGLAGLSAAHTLLERGANVLLLDKQPLVSHSVDLTDVLMTFVDSWEETLPKLHLESMVPVLKLNRN